MGIQYRKQFDGEQGWFAAYWSPLDEPGTAPPPEYFPGAASVKMQVERSGISIIASYTFRDATGNNITGSLGSPGTTVHTFSGRDRFGSDYSSATPLRWGRFMSFVPNNGKGNIMQDTADMTKISNARFTELQLFKWESSRWEDWGSSLIDYAWSVQTANIVNLELSAVDPSTKLLYDKLSLVQQVWYPQRCIRFINRASTKQWFTTGKMGRASSFDIKRSEGWYSIAGAATSQVCVDCTVNTMYVLFDDPKYSLSTGLTSFCIRDPDAFSITELLNADPSKYWAFTDSKTKAKADDCESLGAGYVKKDHSSFSFNLPSLASVDQACIAPAAADTVLLNIEAIADDIDGWLNQTHDQP
ncbi:hypothetical protein OEZ86_014199 [Tetradesmus obliquus]|nr:hypothetical protein OEZ86_014199 [Tetradesmus obliquus]